MEEENYRQRNEKVLPPWLATFADMMTLLLAFFVLLLSFAELDILKFKKIAGAMESAFGVQRDVRAAEIPKGTSVIARHYSPGQPTEVAVLEIMRESSASDIASRNDQSLSDAIKQAQQAAMKKAEKEAEELKNELADAVNDGLLEIEAFNDRVLIRIREKGSFGSGQALLKKDFLPILKLIADVLNKHDGLFIVTGHTDDIPIETNQFGSNWALSAARAISVVHFFIRDGNIDPERLELRALSDNLPIVPNDSWENRAQNRRIEISVLHGNSMAIDMELPTENVDIIGE